MNIPEKPAEELLWSPAKIETPVKTYDESHSHSHDEPAPRESGSLANKPAQFCEPDPIATGVINPGQVGIGKPETVKILNKQTKV